MSSTIIVDNGLIGGQITIKITNKEPRYRYSLRYLWGNKTGAIASNVGASTTWTIPMDFANDIPSSTKGNGIIFADVYNERGTKIFTKQVIFTASIPDNIKPTFAGITLTDTNNVARGLLTGNNFLQIISNIQVNFNGASGVYSSTITGYKAEIVNRNLVTNSNGGTLGIMNFNGSATIRASVIDSRGRQSDTRDVTINVIEYFAPILSFTALRTRQTPNIIQVVRNAKIAPITLSGSQKNIMTLSFKVAPLGSTSFTADNGSASGSWTTQHMLNNSAANMAGNYDATKSFVVIGTLSDKFTRTEFSVTVSTEKVIISYDKDGRVGVGKVVDRGKAGSLDIAGDIYAGGKMIQQFQLTQNDGKNRFTTGTNLDTLKNVGFYSVNNASNAPINGRMFYIVVNAESDSWLNQIAIEKDSNRMWSRTLHNGWRPWREFVGKDDLDQIKNHKNLINTSWTNIGNGFRYKRVADIVYLDYTFQTTQTRQSIGSIPKELAPKSGSIPIVGVTGWVASPDPALISFDSAGNIEVIDIKGRKLSYAGQVSWCL